jgi:hypothetical protein
MMRPFERMSQISVGSCRNLARDVQLAILGEAPSRQPEIGCQNQTSRDRNGKRYLDAPPTQLIPIRRSIF